MRLSPTQVGMYRRCSLQWFFRYRAGIKLRPNLKLVKGRAVHKGAEVGYAFALSTGQRPPVDLVTDAAAQEWDDAAANEGLLLEEGDEKPEDAKDRAIGLTRLHHERVAVHVEPAIVERFVTWKVPDGPEMLGKIDVIEQTGAVRDLKTSGRRENEQQIRVNPQLAIYVAGTEQQGIPTGDVHLDRLVDSKTPDVQSITLTRDQVDVRRTEMVARGVQSGIERELFVPVDDVKTCNWCGYKKMCWGAKWWEYLRNPGTAQRAAQALIEGELLPASVRSVPFRNDDLEVPI